MCWARNDFGLRADRVADRRVDRLASDASTLLVSDADRQRVVEWLRNHTAEGRLTLDEFEERVEETFRARTHGDLHRVLRDLPQAPTPVTRTAPGWLLNPFVVIGAVIAVVSLATGNLVIWPLLVGLGFCLFGGCGRPSAAISRHEAAGPTPRHRGDAVTTV